MSFNDDYIRKYGQKALSLIRKKSQSKLFPPRKLEKQMFVLPTPKNSKDDLVRRSSFKKIITLQNQKPMKINNKNTNRLELTQNKNSKDHFIKSSQKKHQGSSANSRSKTKRININEQSLQRTVKNLEEIIEEIRLKKEKPHQAKGNINKLLSTAIQGIDSIIVKQTKIAGVLNLMKEVIQKLADSANNYKNYWKQSKKYSQNLVKQIQVALRKQQKYKHKELQKCVRQQLIQKQPFGIKQQMQRLVCRNEVQKKVINQLKFELQFYRQRQNKLIDAFQQFKGANNELQDQEFEQFDKYQHKNLQDHQVEQKQKHKLKYYKQDEYKKQQ